MLSDHLGIAYSRLECQFYDRIYAEDMFFWFAKPEDMHACRFLFECYKILIIWKDFVSEP